MLPFIVDVEQRWKLYDESKWLKAQFDLAPQKGFRFLSTFEAGFRWDHHQGPVKHTMTRKAKSSARSPTK